LKADKNKYNN